MPSHKLPSVGSLLGQVLGSVARSTGSGAALESVWAEVVGPLIAPRARPLKLEAGVLSVEVESVHWRKELVARVPELQAALAARLGEGVVKRIEFVPR